MVTAKDETDACFQCKETFHPQKRTQLFCSQACWREYLRRIPYTKEELEKLVWEMPLQEIAAEVGVSGKAVEKRCKRLGIPTPGRGYWAKVYAGLIEKGTRLAKAS